MANRLDPRAAAQRSSRVRTWWEPVFGALLLGSLVVTPPVVAAPPGTPSRSAEQPPAPGAEVRALHAAIMRTRDHQGLAFAVIDKRAAALHVYNAEGHLLASTAVLLGLSRGDDSVPGIGDRALGDIQPHERTTPAGRFVSEPGVNLQGEDIVWIDYTAAVSIHRLRPVHVSQRRAQRLASPTPDDNRITHGCVNVPQAFYERHLAPLFGRQHALVYVLPEQRPLAEVFAQLLQP
ncbi:hypothetical protein [Acidovorax lacteus]|uniref:hypothetical protein n=1 Tax=Acidovorax lacteus TaxID=1924988 RepID=UPI0031EF8155